MNAEEYAEYRQSRKWAEKRRQCMDAHGHRCTVCGCTWIRREIHVHHLHYKNVGNEEPEDLVPLCSVHHESAHNDPGGYGVETVKKLKRDCEDDFWDDVVPNNNRSPSGDGWGWHKAECPHCYCMFTEYEMSCCYCGHSRLLPSVVDSFAEDLEVDCPERAGDIFNL